MPLIDEQGATGDAARTLGLDRKLCIAPRQSARSRQFEIRQAGRDLGVGCRGGRHPCEIDPSTGRAGELHAIEFEHFTGLGHELVEVERPLHGRRLCSAEGRHLHRRRGDPRLFDPQPVATGRPTSAPKPGGERLVPPQQPLLTFATFAWPAAGSRRILLRGNDALHGSDVPRTGANLQHTVVAIGPRDGCDLQLPARDPHIGTHREAARHGPRGGSEIDIDGDREILPRERLGPIPRAPGRQADPARGLGLEQLRVHLQRSHRDPVAIDRQIDGHLAAIERDQLCQRVGLADRQLRSRYHTGHSHRFSRGPDGPLPRRTDVIAGGGIAGWRQCDVQPHVGQSVEHVRRVEPRGQHA